MASVSLLLLLADGRFPAGAHAHSGGVEEAVNDGRVTDSEDLRAFLTGRLHTTGLVNACLAAASTRAGRGFTPGDRSRVEWSVLDAEAEARIASPALRAASRRQGRQLLRAAIGVWPGPALDALADACGAGPHHPVALGSAAAAAGLAFHHAALIAAQESVAAPATAAVRLLGLDPVGVAALIARLAPEVDHVADQAAAAAAAGDLARLHAGAAPLIELGAQRHARREVRLFAS